MNHPALPDRDDEEAGVTDDPGLDIAALRRRREIVLTVLAITLVLGASLFTAIRFLRIEPVSPAELRALTQQAIREALPSGLALQFSSPAETEIGELGDGSREVSGNVVGVTFNGEARYYRFRCVLTQADDRHWRPARLDLMPQQ